VCFRDYDNDGDVDIVVNCVNSLPQLLRCDAHTAAHWAESESHRHESNRNRIGARCAGLVARTQPDRPEPLVMIDEVRSGGSYFSQSDLRLHFGLDQAKTVDVARNPLAFRPGRHLQGSAADRLYSGGRRGKEAKAYMLPAMRRI